MWLLAASYYFYMCWRVEYIVLIVGSTLVDYFVAIQMDKQETQEAKKPYLWLSVLVNLGILVSFKYFNFFSDSLRATFNYFNIFYDFPIFNVLLPVGISFYTFQTMSYTIDVYRGKTKPERHLGIFALYVSFFPQLVAGPIERSNHLLPQFRQEFTFDYDRIKSGLQLMMWGFFKKIVIADRIGQYVDLVYSDPHSYQGYALLWASLFFGWQVYCDFSGYSDIAIGAAKVMGFDLMENFNRPFFSKTIAEFWRRWHISLSTWFRDYFYIPLGGSRTVKWRWYYNLFITFAVSGLWHGATWNHVIWGSMHGFYMVFAIWTYSLRDNFNTAIGLKKSPFLYKCVQVFWMHFLLLIGWFVFRANGLGDTAYFFKNTFLLWDHTAELLILLKGWLIGGTVTFGYILQAIERALSWDLYFMFLSLAGITFLECIHLIQRKHKMRDLINSQPTLVRWAIYVTAIIVILEFGVFNRDEFIYFQF